MAREDFIEKLKHQYQEKLAGALSECEHDNGHCVDISILYKKVQKIQKASLLEGLPKPQFEELLHGCFPEEVYLELKKENPASVLKLMKPIAA